jgi:hypothetical protein
MCLSLLVQDKYFVKDLNKIGYLVKIVRNEGDILGVF